MYRLFVILMEIAGDAVEKRVSLNLYMKPAMPRVLGSARIPVLMV